MSDFGIALKAIAFGTPCLPKEKHPRQIPVIYVNPSTPNGKKTRGIRFRRQRENSVFRRTDRERGKERAVGAAGIGIDTIIQALSAYAVNIKSDGRE
jgi:hypothetical protein